MALNSASLSTLLENKMIQKFGWQAGEYDATYLKMFTDSVAEAVVEHIKNDSEFSGALADTGVTVDTQSGDGNVDNGAVTGGII